MAADNFTRADAANLGANWTVSAPGGGADIGIQTNQCACFANASRAVWWLGAGVSTGNHSSRVTYVDVTTGYAGVMTNAQTGSTDIAGYLLYNSKDDQHLRLVRVDDAVTSTLITDYGVVSVNNMQIDLSNLNGTLTAKLNTGSGFTTLGTSSGQTTYTNAKPGIFMNQNNVRFSAWSGTETFAFGYYKSVTLDASQSGSADSTDWPLTIGLGVGPQSADADLKTTGNGGYVQSSSGYDIRPYSDSALTTPLTYELVYYDGVNGKLEMHVKISTLSHSSNTVIYLAFGESTIYADETSILTWDSNFGFVAHLKDGSTLSVADSSQSGNNATNSGMSAATGQIDGGMSNNGSGNFVEAPIFYPGTGLTLQAWTYYNSLSDFEVVFDKRIHAPNSTAEVYLLYVGADGKFLYNLNTASNPLVINNANFKNSTAIGTGAWHHIAFTYDGSGNVKAYLDGAADGTATYVSGAVYNGSSRLRLAGYDASTYLTDGKLDEMRVSGVDRSSSWIVSDYNSQKSSSTFITWGARTSTSGGGGSTPGNARGMFQLLGVGA